MLEQFRQETKRRSIIHRFKVGDFIRPRCPESRLNDRRASIEVIATSFDRMTVKATYPNGYVIEIPLAKMSSYVPEPQRRRKIGNAGKKEVRA